MSENLRVLRRSERFCLVLPARCRSRTGFVDRVVITDISPEGCRIESQALTVNKGDYVVIQPQALEGLCGQIVWVRDHSAGIEFQHPLYGPVVEHLQRNHAQFLPPAESAPRPSLRSAA